MCRVLTCHLANYGLGFESCLEEGNGGWMRAMLILKRDLLGKNGKWVREPILA